jgi:hypothetical protein
MDIGQRYLDPLVVRQVNACYAYHLLLPLPLFVLGVALADHPDDAPATDDLAMLTDSLNARSYFHFRTLFFCSGAASEDIVAAAKINAGSPELARAPPPNTCLLTCNGT